MNLQNIQGNLESVSVAYGIDCSFSCELKLKHLSMVVTKDEKLCYNTMHLLNNYFHTGVRTLRLDDAIPTLLKSLLPTHFVAARTRPTYPVVELEEEHYREVTRLVMERTFHDRISVKFPAALFHFIAQKRRMANIVVIRYRICRLLLPEIVFTSDSRRRSKPYESVDGCEFVVVCETTWRIAFKLRADRKTGDK